MGANVDVAELDKFNAQAQSWWDPRGPFRPLHDLNPLRLDYVLARATVRDRPVLDVGCGGGILAEGLRRAGARLTAIDMAAASCRATCTSARAGMGISGGTRLSRMLSWRR